MAHEVPHDIKSSRGKPAYSTAALYDHANKIIVLSYALKRNKNALMLSSSHSSYDPVGEDQKPSIILDYNKNKGGVDTIDENTEEFSCLRKSVWWPMVVNYNLINIACCNGYFLIMKNHLTQTRRTVFGKFDEAVGI